VGHPGCSPALRRSSLPHRALSMRETCRGPCLGRLRQRCNAQTSTEASDVPMSVRCASAMQPGGAIKPAAALVMTLSRQGFPRQSRALCPQPNLFEDIQSGISIVQRLARTGGFHDEESLGWQVVDARKRLCP